MKRTRLLIRIITVIFAMITLERIYMVSTNMMISVTESIEVEGGIIENDIAPKIALTFDDGPSDIEGGTEYLLEGLNSRGVKATFFVLGSRAEENPMIMAQMFEDGHLIGNHTYSHVDLTNISLEMGLEELQKTNAIIESITGDEVIFVRSPYGTWDREYELYIDMIPVFWTIDSLDWTTDNVGEIVNNVVTKASENDIILMHDCYPSTAQAAFWIIDILQERGFEFVTVDEILLE